MRRTSRGKFNRLQRATTEFTTSALDGYGLRGQLPARPAPYASYPVLVHRLASLLHAAFRLRLTTTPWRFAITSPPSGCEGDLHPKAVKHARHTTKRPEPIGFRPLPLRPISIGKSYDSDSLPLSVRTKARSTTFSTSTRKKLGEGWTAICVPLWPSAEAIWSHL